MSRRKREKKSNQFYVIAFRKSFVEELRTEQERKGKHGKKERMESTYKSERGSHLQLEWKRKGLRWIRKEPKP